MGLMFAKYGGRIDMSLGRINGLLRLSTASYSCLHVHELAGTDVIES